MCLTNDQPTLKEWPSGVGWGTAGPECVCACPRWCWAGTVHFPCPSSGWPHEGNCVPCGRTVREIELLLAKPYKSYDPTELQKSATFNNHMIINTLLVYAEVKPILHPIYSWASYLFSSLGFPGKDGFCSFVVLAWHGGSKGGDASLVPHH